MEAEVTVLALGEGSAFCRRATLHGSRPPIAASWFGPSRLLLAAQGTGFGPACGGWSMEEETCLLTGVWLALGAAESAREDALHVATWALPRGETLSAWAEAGCEAGLSLVLAGASRVVALQAAFAWYFLRLSGPSRSSRLGTRCPALRLARLRAPGSGPSLWRPRASPSRSSRPGAGARWASSVTRGLPRGRPPRRCRCPMPAADASWRTRSSAWC